jgi:hypothetical protein
MNPSMLTPIKTDADIADSSLCVRRVYSRYGLLHYDSPKFHSI